MTHTPGPWFFHEPINSKRMDFGVTAGRPFDPSTGAVRRIAWVGNASHHNPDLQDEVRANARLIAAAPTMFDFIAKRAADGDPEASKIMEGIHAVVLTKEA